MAGIFGGWRAGVEPNVGLSQQVLQTDKYVPEAMSAEGNKGRVGRSGGNGLETIQARQGCRLNGYMEGGGFESTGS